MPTTASWFKRPCASRSNRTTCGSSATASSCWTTCGGGASISSRPTVPRPDLILLDLKMPRKDGREALSELKADPRLRSIPIVVLTTSTARDDIGFCYRMGVNSYITKPATFRGLVDLLGTLSKYWFELVELPVVE